MEREQPPLPTDKSITYKAIWTIPAASSVIRGRRIKPATSVSSATAANYLASFREHPNNDYSKLTRDR